MADEKIEVEEPRVPDGLAEAEVDLALIDEINALTFYGCAGNASLGASHAAIAFFCTALASDAPDAAIDLMLDRARKTAREIVDEFRRLESVSGKKPADA